jgi:rare lipoprotein A
LKKLTVAALAALCALSGAAHAGQASKSRGTSEGMASWYQCCKRTANGEAFKPMGITAAHRTLPFGTRLLVEDTKTGKAIEVRVNDRGPFAKKRIIDLSKGAAMKLGIIGRGHAHVRLTVLGGGKDRKERVASVAGPTERPNAALLASND